MKKLFNDSFENWIFDLDNTIYDIKAGLFVKISERITQYIMEVLSFTKEEANLVRSDMYKKYGLTLTGLMREYQIDADEYLDFIHDVTHPLSAMGIEAEFEKILDIKATDYVPKPDPKSYDIMLKSFGILSNQIESSIFIEDTAKNLKPAKLLGLKTVWMENDRNLEDYKDNAEYIDYKYSDLKSFLNDISNSN